MYVLMKKKKKKNGKLSPNYPITPSYLEHCYFTFFKVNDCSSQIQTGSNMAGQIQ